MTTFQPHPAVKAGLTRTQATQVSRTYQHLKDTPYFSAEVAGVIECIAVVPYDEINKFIFLQYYRELTDAVASMGFYRVPYYDVALLVRTGSGQITCTGIERYLRQQRRADGHQVFHQYAV